MRRIFAAPPLSQTIFLAIILFAPLLSSTSDAKETANASETKSAIFAGGCFWCMEHPYDEVDGVISTTSGYTGGHKDNPTYRQVSNGGTGHTEAVRIVYDPKNSQL